MTRWTAKELAYLSNNYEFSNAKEIAKHLGRTEKAVMTQARRIGINKNEHRRYSYVKLEIISRLKMKDYRIDKKVGESVKVVAGDYDSKRNGVKRRIKGKVIFKNKSYLVVDTGKYKESFLFSDFYTGAAQIV